MLGAGTTVYGLNLVFQCQYALRSYTKTGSYTLYKNRFIYTNMTGMRKLKLYKADHGLLTHNTNAVMILYI